MAKSLVSCFLTHGVYAMHTMRPNVGHWRTFSAQSIRQVNNIIDSEYANPANVLRYRLLLMKESTRL